MAIESYTTVQEAIRSMNLPATFERYGRVTKQLNDKILDKYVNQELILETADVLGIEHDETSIHYEDETEMTVHAEFMLYEFEWDALTAAERYLTEERLESATELQILKTTLAADPSLFEVDDVIEPDGRLVMSDILDEGDEFQLTDPKLSRTAEPGLVVFCRPVHYEEFTTTSGVTLPFPADGTESLLADYEGLVDDFDHRGTSMEGFVAVYELYRERGLPIRYT